jgi:hypothetical protein
MNNDTEISSALEVALSVIRELAAQGHSSRYIANALDIRRVPRLTARARTWNAGTVWRLMQQHGIKIGRRTW